MSTNLLPPCLTICGPTLATRRFARQRLHPTTSHRPETIGGFQFVSPSNGQLVTFDRPLLLPRARAFDEPPEYDDLSRPSSGWKFRADSSHSARSDRQAGDVSPTPSKGSSRSYRRLSPAPPAEAGYSTFVPWGMESAEPELEPLLGNLLHHCLFAAAPFITDCRLRQCLSPTCPIDIPHNLGLYFHHGQRPGRELQQGFQQLNLHALWDGGNPPPIVWQAMVGIKEGVDMQKESEIIESYRRLHCPGGSQEAMKGLLVQGGLAKAARQHREKERRHVARQRAIGTLAHAEAFLERRRNAHPTHFLDDSAPETGRSEEALARTRRRQPDARTTISRSTGETGRDSSDAGYERSCAI